MSSLGASVCKAVEKTGIDPLKCIQHPYFLADQGQNRTAKFKMGTANFWILYETCFLLITLGVGVLLK